MTASVFSGPGAVEIAAVGVAALVLARRRWEAAVAVAVAADVLAWSWVPWLKTAGNVVYWGSVAGIGLELARLALSSRLAQRLLVGSAAVTFLLASTSLWSLSRHDTLRESATFASVLVIVSFAVVRLRAEPLGSGLLGALAVLVPGMLVVTIAVIVGDHSRAVAEGGGVSGFVNGPNALGLLVALSLAFLLAHRWVAERWSLLGLTMGVVAFVVTLSASRTGYVALLAALLVYETGRRRWPRLALGLCAALAGAALAVVWAPDVPTLGRPLADRAQVTELFGGGRPAGQSLFGALTGARDEAWREAVALLPRRPLLGSGFGTGSDVFEHDGVRSRFRNFVGAFDPHANVHEAYLQVLLELGIPGGIVFLAPLLAAFGATLAGLRRGWRSRLEGACGATLAASLVCALFESVFAGFGAMTLLTWLAAAGVGLLPLLEGE